MSSDSRKFAEKIDVYVAPGGNASIGTQIVGAQQKLNPPNNLQFQGCANFLGRSHELTLLRRDRLQQVGVVAITAVAGMGGVGKTELATQYAKLHKKDYPGGICWLSAIVTDLAAEIIQFTQLYMNLEVPQELLGQQLSLEQRVEWCWQNWQPTEGLALIILDDVTSLEGCCKLGRNCL